MIIKLLTDRQAQLVVRKNETLGDREGREEFRLKGSLTLATGAKLRLAASALRSKSPDHPFVLEAFAKNAADARPFVEFLKMFEQRWTR